MTGAPCLKSSGSAPGLKMVWKRSTCARPCASDGSEPAAAASASLVGASRVWLNLLERKVPA
jgi:hypothetical protein